MKTTLTKPTVSIISLHTTSAKIVNITKVFDTQGKK